jgi:predicted kinase
VTPGQTLLIVVAGRPGTGKTTVAKRLSRDLRAVYLRLDAIVVPLLDARVTDDEEHAATTGYEIARSIAQENLRLGVPVVVDGLHATRVLRRQWRELASGAGARLQFVETVLADEEEHRRRIERRTGGDSAYPGPSWDNVRRMPSEPWDHPDDDGRVTLETSDLDAAMDAAVRHLRGLISGG